MKWPVLLKAVKKSEKKTSPEIHMCLSVPFEGVPLRRDPPPSQLSERPV